MLKFIGSARFMASLLSNIVNNFSERIHITKCIYGHDNNKKVKHIELNISIAQILKRI